MNTNLSKVPSVNELAQRTRVSDEQFKFSGLMQMVTIKKRQHNAQRID